jgi:predicted Zn-dependent protease
MTDTAEDLVRRATAAFNAGRRDEAKQLCEQGLARTPNEPMLSHLLAAVLFSASESSAARRHIEASLASRQCRRASARRADCARAERF